MLGRKPFGDDTKIRRQLAKKCNGCGLNLMNSMEQLVQCCPFCYRTLFYPAWLEFLGYMNSELNEKSKE